jgi:hypothetical protein
VVRRADGTVVRRFAATAETRGESDYDGVFPSVVGFQGDDVVAVRAGSLVDLSVRSGSLAHTWAGLFAAYRDGGTSYVRLLPFAEIRRLLR